MGKAGSYNKPDASDGFNSNIKNQNSRSSRSEKEMKESMNQRVDENAEAEKQSRKRKPSRSQKSKKKKSKKTKTKSSSDRGNVELKAVSKLHEKIISSEWKTSTSAEMSQVRQYLPLPSKNEKIDDILALGYALFLSQRFQDAHRVFDELYRALPSTAATVAPGVFLGLVQTLSSLNKRDEAVKFSDKLVQARPDFQEGYNIKMQLLSAKDRHDEAISFLTSELKNPKVDKLFLLMLRGKAYYKMKKFASAHIDFTTVNSTAPRSMRAEVSGWLGRTERELGNNDVAAWYLKKSIAHDPTQAETMFELGILFIVMIDDLSLTNSIVSSVM